MNNYYDIMSDPRNVLSIMEREEKEARIKKGQENYVKDLPEKLAAKNEIIEGEKKLSDGTTISYTAESYDF